MDTDDKTLSYAYSKAKCFVFPSLYEGFGIPTLEAFSCGCPVILSSTSSFPEVGGDAVIYANPYDEEDMREKILAVISDENLRDTLINKGRERLKLFDWDKTVAETLKCYEKLLLNELQ